MLFNSIEFLIFFPIVTFLYFILPHQWRWLHLLIASCIFYMFFIPVYIFILLFTIVVDYFAGIYIERSTGRKRKFFLIMSIVANVGVLAVFKYYNFFIENIRVVFSSIGEQPWSFLNIILPIGLSFHTFQAMSYTIEVYRGNQKSERHFGIYALYVMFYPQLVAGPIERPQNLLHQFREKHSFEIERVYSGLRLMLWGLFKKVVIADRLSIYVDAVYSNPSSHPPLNLGLATFFFAIQIYCDFSGYSDIAIGSAKVMGFDLMTNFKRPYFATNIQDFWKRWHVSLSSWFKDFVYIPLGGNRISAKRMFLNIAIVFLLSGLWHGANWTFILWGAVHAVFTILYLLYKRGIAPVFNVPSLVAGAITFICVCFSWIFFRAASVSEAFLIIKKLFTFDIHSYNTYVVTADHRAFGSFWVLFSLLTILLLILNDKIQNVFQNRFHRRATADVLYHSFVFFLVLSFGVFQKQSFIYFQF
jgi:alginate O-acetyltransferase complex protein AlgI